MTLDVQNSADDPQMGQGVVKAMTSRRETQIARILDAAQQCFIQSGFQGASMQEICNTAQMSPGALYRYFPSKDAIVLAICEQHRQEDAKILMSMRQNPNVIEGAVNATMEHIRHVHESGFAPIFSEIRASSQRNPALGEACDAAMLQARDSFKEYLSEAIAEDKVTLIVPLEKLLDIMMALADGLVANDLPSKGIEIEHIQTVMRACLLACIIPNFDSTIDLSERRDALKTHEVPQ